MGLSQADVAQKLKLGSGGIQFISNIEREIANYPPDMLKNLCTIYKLNYAEISAQQVRDMTKKHETRLKSRYGVK